MSNLTSTTDALSRVTQLQYDDFNQPVKIIYPPATPGGPRLFETMSYDALGNVTLKTDTAGRTSEFTYDSVIGWLHLLTRTTERPDWNMTDFREPLP